jgi:serine phosphatase RsbU (regulator of sigma subunit)/pSer/pThr/pTyr-binding forkhead associated (FHA) protein
MSVRPQEKEGFYLCWTEDSNGRIYRLEDGETVVGRSSDCQIIINNRNVSRRHARIARVAGQYRLTDLNSTYGTFVRGARITEHALKPGDRFELGADNIPVLFTQDPDAVRTDGASTLENHLLDLKLVGKEESSDLEKISWILDFQQRWEDAFTPETAFDQILHSALKLSGAERAYILVRERAGGMKYATGMNAVYRKLPEGEFKTSRSVVGHVERTSTPIFMVEGLEAAFAAQESVIATGVKAIACLPLSGIPTESGSSAMLGILYLDSTKPMHALSGLDERILKKLAGDAGNVLERIEFVKSIEQRKTLERELALAEEMQKALLPREIPVLAGWELAAYSKPTRYVGGDFYDFLQTPRGSLLAILGDVSGKGVSAALLSSMILGSLHANIRSEDTIQTATNALNKLMCDKAPTGRFVTLFIVEFDQAGNGHFISAGHTTAYLYRAAGKRIEELQSNGMIVGAFGFAQFETSSTVLDTGDVLILYSDGLTEAENAAGEMLGEEPVLQTIRRSGPEGAQATLAALTELLQRFTEGRGQTDDITIAAVCRR